MLFPKMAESIDPIHAQSLPMTLLHSILSALIPPILAPFMSAIQVLLRIPFAPRIFIAAGGSWQNPPMIHKNISVYVFKSTALSISFSFARYTGSRAQVILLCPGNGSLLRTISAKNSLSFPIESRRSHPSGKN